jgi:serine/threonine-protein kinase
MSDVVPTMTPDANKLAAGTMVGEYRIEYELGRGGMGCVYAAIHPVIAKRAAIKVLHAELSVNTEAVERFVQEARSVNQIGHPNIVDIFAFGTLPDGRSYFVMEWLRGESLRQRLQRGPIPLLEAFAIIDTITGALAAAHDNGIVHRDLKPDNVFLVAVKGAQPQVKLLDFGIAKLTGAEGMHRTQTGHMLGTPAYVSPEQARAHDVDHRTDIYALGAMLFELCTGHLVFAADNAADMIAKHLLEPPRSAAALNPAVSPALDALIARMLAKDAAARPQLDEIRDGLRTCLTPPAIMQHATWPTPSPGAITPSRPISVGVAPPRRSRVLAIAITATAAIGVGLAIFIATANDGRSTATAVPTEGSNTPHGEASQPRGSDETRTTAAHADETPHVGTATDASVPATDPSAATPVATTPTVTSPTSKATTAGTKSKDAHTKSKPAGTKPTDGGQPPKLSGSGSDDPDAPL